MLPWPLHGSERLAPSLEVLSRMNRISLGLTGLSSPAGGSFPTWTTFILLIGILGAGGLLSERGFVAAALAQTPPPHPVWGEVYAGGELEEYLRLVQIAGAAPVYPFSIRSFSVKEVTALSPGDSAHPWSSRFLLQPGSSGGVRYQLHAPRTALVYNSAFPYGTNDGALWSGRGASTVLQLGATARYGAISLSLAPTAFWAQNADFEVTQQVGDSVQGAPYRDWRRPTQIDLPQRFGDGSYARVDWGESTLRGDALGAALGLSTARQIWGPASEFPLVLGPNAPGFAHAFAGTSNPMNIWIGRGHGRFVWGRLEQSEYSPVSPDSSARFMAGIVAVFTPRWVPGLEIGGSRFFHSPWPAEGLTLRHLLKPLETFVKVDLQGPDEEEIAESAVANQLASFFARWVFPGVIEVYGELASEDHRQNFRDFILEPDHNSAYTIGARKLWRRAEGEFWTLRGEVLNAEPSHLARARRQEPFYVHALTRQGHTHRGQVLGSPAANGGAGSLFQADRYHPGGRWSLAWRRTLRQEYGEYLETGKVERPDVLQSLRAEALLFRGRWELLGGVEGVYNFNRDFDSGLFNLNASIGVRARL